MCFLRCLYGSGYGCDCDRVKPSGREICGSGGMKGGLISGYICCDSGYMSGRDGIYTGVVWV